MHTQPRHLELHLLMQLGLPAWSVGTLCAGLPLLLCFGLLYATGESLSSPTATGDLRLTGQAHVAALVSLLLGYLTGVGVHFARSGDGAVAAGDVRLGRGEAAGSATSLLGGMVGVLIGIVLILLSARAIRLQEPERDVFSAGEVAIDVVSLILLWGIGRAAVLTLRVDHPARRQDVPIDLLNLSPLFGAARAGLRIALAWIGGISLASAIMAFDPNPGVLKEAGWIIATMLGLSLAVGSFALLAPMWRLRERIREAKEDATARTLQQLRSLREQEAPRPGEEADLLLRLSFIAGISTWPIDIVTLRRFGFYVLFPVASWLFGTVTQQLLDIVLVSELVRILLELPGRALG